MKSSGKHRWLKVVLCAIFFCVLLEQLLTSSVFLCEVCLPLVGEVLGMDLDAGRCSFRLFTFDDNLSLENVRIHGANGVAVSIEHADARISLGELLRGGRIQLRRVSIDRATMLLDANSLRGASDGEAFDADVVNRQMRMKKLPEWCVIERILVKSLDLRYAALDSYNGMRCFVYELHIRELAPNKRTNLSFRSALSLHTLSEAGGFEKSNFNLSVDADADFNDLLLPVRLHGTFDLEGNDGAMGVLHSYSGEVLCHYNSDDAKLLLEHFNIAHKNGQVENELTVLSVSGMYDTLADVLELRAESNGLYPLQRLFRYLKIDSQSAIPKPGRLTATLTKVRDKVELQCSGVLYADAFSDASVSHLEWTVGTDMHYNLSDGTLRLTSFSGKLHQDSNGKKSCVLSAEIAKPFLFSLGKKNEAVRFEANDAAFRLDVTDAPLQLVSLTLPVRCTDGTLNSSMEIRADSKQKRLVGVLRGRASHVEPAYAKNSHRRHDLTFSAKLHSTGTDCVQSLAITDAVFDLFPEGIPSKAPTSAAMEGASVHTDASGTVRFLPTLIDLKGSCTLFPFRLPLPADAKWTRKVLAQPKFAKFTRTPLLIDVSCNADFRNRRLVFRGNSTFHCNTLPGMQDCGTPLHLQINGQTCFQRNVQTLDLNQVTLSLPGHLLVDGTVSAALPVAGLNTASLVLSSRKVPPSGVDVSLKLERLSDSFFNAVIGTLEPEDEVVQEILSKLRFHNITFTSRMSYTPGGVDPVDLRGRTFTLKDTDLRIFLSADSPQRPEFELQLDSPLRWTAENGFLPATATAHVRNLKGSFINTFIRTHTHFLFGDFPIDGVINLSLKDGIREVWAATRLTLTNYRCTKYGMTIRHGDCEVTGDVVFKDNFSVLEYGNAFAKSLSDGGKDLLVSSRGRVMLCYPLDNDIHFQIINAGPAQVSNLCDAIRDGVNVENFAADGTIDIKSRDDLNRQSYDFALNVRDLRLQSFNPAVPRLQPLHGAIRCKVNYDDLAPLCRVDELSVRLARTVETSGPPATDKPRDVLHACFSGEIAKSRGREAKSTFLSDAVDWHYMTSALRKSPPRDKSPSTSPAVPGEKDSPTAPLADTWFFSAELPPLNIDGDRSDITVRIRNWTYADFLTLAADGTLSLSDGMLTSGDMHGTLNRAEFDLLSNLSPALRDGETWKISVSLGVRDLDIRPFVDAFGSEPLKKRNVTGHIKNAFFTWNSDGVTIPNLDRSLSYYAKLDVDNLSFPLYETKRFRLASVLAYPLLSMDAVTRKILGVSDQRLDDFLKSVSLPHGIVKSVRILSGDENVEFSRGQMILQSSPHAKRTDLDVVKCLFVGPNVKMRFNRPSMMNIVHNSIGVEANVILRGFPMFHVFLSGRLDSPDVSNFQSFSNEMSHWANVLRQPFSDVEFFSKLWNLFSSGTDHWSFDD